MTRRWRAGILGVASEVTALTECSLSVDAGEIVGVTGGAGAGKSTLLMLAAGRATPTAGTIRWGGSSDPAASGAQLVGARPWEYGFLTVRQALVFHAEVMALRDAARPTPTRFMPLMRRVGLQGLARVRLGQLSALDRFRVVIAQALVATPRLLCCDEPFAHCGPAERERGTELLRALARSGIALLIATRDADALRALGLADRIHHLEAGRLGEPQPPRQSVLELAVGRPEEAISRLLPRLPSLGRRGRRLRVPLGGTSPEAVLALCRDVGVAVRGSRVAEEALPRQPAPR
ncbi:MAG: ATP-binding cassette domain-containing protein [Gemmatimonadaceae bacterium]